MRNNDFYLVGQQWFIFSSATMILQEWGKAMKPQFWTLMVIVIKDRAARAAKNANTDENYYKSNIGWGIDRLTRRAIYLLAFLTYTYCDDQWWWWWW